jgi:hypothetical protein
MDRREASTSKLVTAHHAARYLGISGQAFSRWVWKYGIPSYDEDGARIDGFATGGARRFLRGDLDAANAVFNERMAAVDATWRHRPVAGA